MITFVRHFALLLVLFLATVTAQAQFQLATNSPSGGTFTPTGQGVYTTSGSTRSGGGGGNPASCGGALTWNWTWQGPTGTAPTSVILTVVASATWSGSPPPNGGSCNDGFGDTPLPKTGFYTSQTSSGTHYAIVSVSNNTVTCSVTPVASGASASVSETVTPTPVIVTLQGLDTNNNVLVGQHLQVSVSVGTFQITSYGWTIPGDYYIGVSWLPGPSTLPTTAWTHPYYHNYDLDEGEVSQADTPNFFYGGAQALAQVIGSFQISDPTGKIAIGAAPGQTQNFTCMAPTHYLSLSCSGNAYINNLTLFAGNPNGMALTCWVSTQSEFASDGTGYYCEVQLVSGTMYTIVNGVKDYHKNITVECLDTTFPYGYDDITIPADASIEANTGSGNPSPSEDTPQFGVGGASYYNVALTFNNFLAYQPPSNGVGIEIVPLAYTQWGWNGSGNIPGTLASPIAGKLVDPAPTEMMEWQGYAS